MQEEEFTPRHRKAK
jgi:hypothetical protein